MTTVPAHLLGDTDVPVSEDKLVRAKKMAKDFFDLETEIEVLTAKVKELTTKKLEMQHRVLPDFFAELGIDNVGLPDDNADIKVKPYYKASIAAEWEPEKREEAFKALDANGGGALIRSTVTVEFAKEEHEEAKALVEFLRQKWPGANRHDIGQAMVVPWNSLTSWMRAEHEAGRTLVAKDEKGEESVLPWSTIGGEIGRIAKVEKRKK